MAGAAATKITLEAVSNVMNLVMVVSPLQDEVEISLQILKEKAFARLLVARRQRFSE